MTIVSGAPAARPGRGTGTERHEERPSVFSSDDDSVAPLGERLGKITAVCGGETGDVVVDVVEVERDHLAPQEGRATVGSGG